MPGKRPLKGGAPRLLGFHGGAEGQAYYRAYHVLAARYGPFRDAVTRFEAGRVAVAAMQLERATTELTKAQRARRIGKGRRPDVRAIERLARRQGKADMTYERAIRRLEAMLAQQGSGDPLADYFASRSQSQAVETDDGDHEGNGDHAA